MIGRVRLPDFIVEFDVRELQRPSITAALEGGPSARPSGDGT
jgi:hypothetical protein